MKKTLNISMYVVIIAVMADVCFLCWYMLSVANGTAYHIAWMDVQVNFIRSLIK